MEQINRGMNRYLLFMLVLLGPLQTTVAQENNQSFMDGLDAGITYTADIFSNTHGGNETGIRYMDNVDLEVSFDTDEGLGWGSTEFYIYGLANQGGSISQLAGDIQGVSNIESETSWRIYEA